MFVWLELGVSLGHRRTVFGEPNQPRVIRFNGVEKSASLLNQIIVRSTGPNSTRKQRER